jgi:hypothetical protein
MFRDLKEYQEIAKIYAEKVSKPENLDERRGSSVEQLKKNREAAIPNKPAPAPQKGAGGGVGNPTNTRGTGTKDFEFKKPNTSASNKRAQMSIKRRTPVNTDSTGKRIPTTAEIRAKNKAAGGTGMSNIPKSGSGGGMEASAFSDKDSSSTPQAKPKMGSPDSKFIKRSKGPGFVKRGTPGAQRAENIEKNRNRAKEMAKARIAAKKAAMANEEFTPYDFVLEYLLSTEQVATIEEANYVMTEMDAETIQGIVEEQKKTLIEKPDDGYIGPKFLGIKTVGQRRKEHQLDKNLERLSKTGDSPDARTMLNIPLDYKITPEQKQKYGFK